MTIHEMRVAYPGYASKERKIFEASISLLVDKLADNGNINKASQDADCQSGLALTSGHVKGRDTDGSK